MADERNYKVTDSSATANHPNRTHEILMDGKVKAITFNYGVPTMLTFEEAAKFQRPGFTVENDGVILEKPSEVPPAAQLDMKPNECIARFEEMTQEALFLRVAMLPGGEKLKKTNSKIDLIKFLTEFNEKKMTPNGPDEGESGTMTQAELDALEAAAA